MYGNGKRSKIPCDQRIEKEGQENVWFKESDNESKSCNDNGYERNSSLLKGKRIKHRSDRNENSDSDANINDYENGNCDDLESEDKSNSKDTEIKNLRKLVRNVKM